MTYVINVTVCVYADSEAEALEMARLQCADDVIDVEIEDVLDLDQAESPR